MRQEDHSYTRCTQHSVSLSPQEKRGRGSGESTRSKKGDKGKGKARKGRAEEWWILLIAIVIPPLQKVATSIKSLMIPALCHDSVGEGD